MNTLLDDWNQLSKENIKFPESHFYTLFHENREQESLELIFDGMKHKEQLISRLNTYFDGRKIFSSADTKRLLELDLAEKKRLCNELNDPELVQYLTVVKYTEISREEFKTKWRSDCPHHWVNELIGDYMRPKASKSLRNQILLDALYGLTTDYNLVWCLGESFYDADFNPQFYFDVWKNNIDYILGEGEVFVLNSSL